MTFIFITKDNAAAPAGTWTIATKGDASGTIVENSPTSLTINAAGTSDHANILYAYKTITSGDIQVKALIPTSWTGHVETWTGFGVGLSEGTAYEDYWAQTWWPNLGGARAKYGTYISQNSMSGIAGTSLPRWLAITYDATANEIKFWESADDADWFQIGTTLSKTLTYDVVAYVWGASQDPTLESTATLTNCAVSATITISEATPPEPGNRTGIIQEITLLDNTFEPHGDIIDGVHIKTYTDANVHVSQAGGGTYGGTWDATRVNLFTVEGVHGPESDYAYQMTLRYDCPYTDNENAPRTKLFWIPGGYGSVDMLAHNTEYWLCIPIFLPANYERDGQFGRETFMQLHNDSTAPGMLEISIDSGNWGCLSRLNALSTLGGVDVDHIKNANVTSDLGKITYFTWNFRFNPFSTQTVIDASMGAKAQVGETYPANTGMMRVWKTMDPNAVCYSDDMGTVTNTTGIRQDILVSNLVNVPVGRVPDWYSGISGRPSIQPELGFYKSGWFNSQPFASRPAIPHAKSTKAGPIITYFVPGIRLGDGSSNFQSIHPLQISEPGGGGGESQQGNIIANYSPSNGSFDEWHFNTDENQVQFSFVTAYGRPPNYGSTGTGAGTANQTQSGDGSYLDIVSASSQSPYPTGPARTGDFAYKFVIKNSVAAGGTAIEPDDCDIATDCASRRTHLQDSHMTIATDELVATIPNNAERWMSVSVYLESDFPVDTASGFFALMGLKGAFDVSSGPYSAPINGWMGLFLGTGGFSIRDTWIGNDMAGGTNPPTVGNQDYRYQFSYGPTGCNDSNQDIHYVPNVSTAGALLADVNLGGWTDFIFHWRTDPQEVTPISNNTGFYDVYIRHDSDPWSQILAIRPANINFEGLVYEKGIGIAGEGYTNLSVGLYCAKARIWGAPNNGVAYFDNIKVGDETCNFEIMTPDGSSL